jgi:hypothetical protein
VHLDAAVAAADPATHDAATRARYLAWVREPFPYDVVAVYVHMALSLCLCACLSLTMSVWVGLQLGQAWLGRGNLGEGDDAYARALTHARAAAALDPAAVPDDVMAHLTDAAASAGPAADDEHDDDDDEEAEEEDEEEEE